MGEREEGEGFQPACAMPGHETLLSLSNYTGLSRVIGWWMAQWPCTFSRGMGEAEAYMP